MGDCFPKKNKKNIFLYKQRWCPLGRTPVVDPWWTPDQSCHILPTWFIDTQDWDQQTVSVRDKLTVWPRHAGMQSEGIYGDYAACQRSLVKEIGAVFLFIFQTVVSLELICCHKQIIFSFIYIYIYRHRFWRDSKCSAVVKDTLVA